MLSLYEISPVLINFAAEGTFTVTLYKAGVAVGVASATKG